MDDRIGALSEMGFVQSEKLLSDFGGEDVGTILMASSDIVLIVDAEDKILDTGFSSEDIFLGGGRSWKGRPLFDIVTTESAEKLTELLGSARKGLFSKGRQVNHPLPDADDVPVSYTAIKLDDDGTVILFGKSVAQMASLQQRLMSSQLAMEREVSRFRESEGRYRAAFQLSQSAQIVVEAMSLKVLDINTSAADLIGKTIDGLIGKKFTKLFEEADQELLHGILLAALDKQNEHETPANLNNGDQVNISVATFRQEGVSQLLLTLTPNEEAPKSALSRNDQRVLGLIRSMPDAFVVTNADFTLLHANQAFFDMFGVSQTGSVEGLEIEQFFERPYVDWKVLIANLREHEVVHRFASSMKTAFGQTVSVEIAASRLKMGNETLLGFWIRPSNNIVMGTEVEQENVARSNEQIANLVGHMPLKEIVRETTDLIEKLCIETALDLTKNNRASAAQMLGVSRQSLYTKLENFSDDDF